VGLVSATRSFTTAAGTTIRTATKSPLVVVAEVIDLATQRAVEGWVDKRSANPATLRSYVRRMGFPAARDGRRVIRNIYDVRTGEMVPR
jgi:hypothetical protein